jgi:hypothetical protein
VFTHFIFTSTPGHVLLWQTLGVHTFYLTSTPGHVLLWQTLGVQTFYLTSTPGHVLLWQTLGVHTFYLTSTPGHVLLWQTLGVHTFYLYLYPGARVVVTDSECPDILSYLYPFYLTSTPGVRVVVTDSECPDILSYLYPFYLTSTLGYVLLWQTLGVFCPYLCRAARVVETDSGCPDSSAHSCWDSPHTPGWHAPRFGVDCQGCERLEVTWLLVWGSRFDREGTSSDAGHSNIYMYSPGQTCIRKWFSLV